MQVCSQPDSIERDFTKVGLVMSTTGEDDHLTFLHKFSSCDYLFVYDADDNNVFSLIQPTTDSSDTLEAFMKDEDVVDNMGDGMLEAMALKNGKISDESDYSCGQEHEIYDESYSLSGSLEKITRYNIYIYI